MSRNALMIEVVTEIKTPENPPAAVFLVMLQSKCTIRHYINEALQHAKLYWVQILACLISEADG